MFHLCKSSRRYTGLPYRGATSGNTPAACIGFDDACRMAATFNERNPVGWDVYDEATGEKVFSTTDPR